MGIKDLVDTDYTSSEHSDAGMALKADWDARRRKYGGGESALEVQAKQQSETFDHLPLFI